MPTGCCSTTFTSRVNQASELRLQFVDLKANYYRVSTTGREIIAIQESPTKLSERDKFQLSQVYTPRQLHTWQDHVPGIWTTFLIGVDGIWVRTDLMKNTILYEHKDSESLYLSSNPEILPGRQIAASHQLALTSMLYPGPPVSVDHTDLSSSDNFLDAGCTYELSHLGSRKIYDRKLPEADKSLSEHAPVLRDTMIRSVLATEKSALGADLSGGFDSTTICYILDADGAKFKTFTGANTSNVAQDQAWAKMSLKDLSNADPYYLE